MTVATAQGAWPFSKLPFFTIGVGTVQLPPPTVVVVVTVVVYTVVGLGVAVKMQEQALLRREAGYCVVAGKSRLSSRPRLAAATVALR